MGTEDFVEIPISLKITNDVIDDIMEKALNDGILHWSYDAKPKYNQRIPAKNVISNGGILLLYSMNDSVYQLTKDKLIIGLQQALPYLFNIINGVTLDANSIDSDSADLIVQLALFNELVFD